MLLIYILSVKILDKDICVYIELIRNLPFTTNQNINQLTQSWNIFYSLKFLHSEVL